MDSSSPRKYAEKEAFVTGHDGTTPIEIFLLCLAVPIGLRLQHKLRSYFTNSIKRHDWLIIAMEFTTLILPNLLLQTSLLPYIIGPILLLVLMSTLSYIIPHDKRATNNQDTTNNVVTKNITRPPFLTVHRATIYIQTAIAILAVDFPIFPRRFCKTEVSGYGWMDLGAASFIIIAGLSSASQSVSNNHDSTLRSTKKAVFKCTPLLILGIVRLITIKGVEYQEHISEYGVHWNFFFTLCCVEGSMVVWKYVKGRFLCVKLPLNCIVACALMMSYQMYLSVGGGQDFIENGPRSCSEYSTWQSLCSAYFANREGMLGVIGYLSLRLLSESMARYCIWPNTNSITITTLRQRRLLIASIAFWAAHFFLTSVSDTPTSRRSTNLPFLLWSLAQNTSVLCLMHFAMTGMGDALTSPQIFNSVNIFGLPFFFVSNILTGLVNLLVDTIHSSNEKAMVVLSIYLMAVCLMAILLDKIFVKNTVVDKKLK